MKFLTYSECEKWCNTNGYATEIDSYERPKPCFELHKEYGLPLEYPTHSGHKVVLARTVVKFLLAQSGGLLWITGWSVWPSSEHMPLFTRYRSSFGEERPLIDVPGHLLEPHDDEEAVSILAMSLLFFWDCYVLPISKRGTFFTSHDEYCWLIGSSEDALLSAQTSFETFIQNDTEY